MSVDPLRSIRIDPAPAIAPVRQRKDGEEEQPRRNPEDEAQQQEEPSDEPDDGLPHVDIRV